MTITLVRHTQPAIASGICYGRQDLALAASFDDEAQQVLMCLPPRIDRILSSPLQRCLQLANLIGAAHDVDVMVDADLQEMDFGTWEGRRWADIERNELDGWADNFLHARPHGGETVAELRTRAKQALSRLVSDNQQVVVVTHSGIIKALLAQGDKPADFSAEVNFGGVLSLLSG